YRLQNGTIEHRGFNGCPVHPLHPVLSSGPQGIGPGSRLSSCIRESTAVMTSRTDTDRMQCASNDAHVSVHGGTGLRGLLTLRATPHAPNLSGDLA
ncbi:MAG TPA: hypothetical protein VKA63_10975, partial [Candidatus Krumholzibacteria bacterium]|nr:hypothetical protein [Candidatus Krumholzibacteria bacterium]